MTRLSDQMGAALIAPESGLKPPKRRGKILASLPENR